METNKCKIYSINFDYIEHNRRLTYQFTKHTNRVHDRIIFLKNCVIV